MRYKRNKSSGFFEFKEKEDVVSRPYTKHERMLVNEWLKRNKPKVFGPGKGVWDGY